MHQYFARPFQLPWLSCLVLALILMIAAMVRVERPASSPAAAKARDVIIVHARTNR